MDRSQEAGGEGGRYAARTLFDKIWDRHTVIRRPDGYCLLYIDRHFVHDASGPSFDKLYARGLMLRRPDLTIATPDHYIQTQPGRGALLDAIPQADVRHDLPRNVRRSGIASIAANDPRQGIVHVIGPELGLSLPGHTIVCGDSHTASHGAVGALAFGIGYSEATHVMATQTVWQRKPKTMRVTVSGTLGFGVSAKDVVLAIIAKIGAGGANGHVIEYDGEVIRDLGMEGRLTVCNMSIEAGARAGMIAPDESTFAYLEGRSCAPQNAAWTDAVRAWRRLPSDEGAVFDRAVALDGADVAPMVTWGTSPEEAAPIVARVPDPAQIAAPDRRHALEESLRYMGLTPGMPLEEITIDRVFIGSCTNGRIEDLRAAAAVVRGRRATVRAWVVPGSGGVKRQAEVEGLDRIFREAGLEWREPGCSMCVGMNGDLGQPGERIASTSNRNFKGRQGRDVRTHLLGPAMAAAAAITGRLIDVRKLK